MNKICAILVCLFSFSCLSTPLSLLGQMLGKEQLVSKPQIDLEFIEDENIKESKNKKKNQFAIDVGGKLVYSLSYVYSVGTSNLSIGGGLGFGWELNSHSFDRNIWEAYHFDFFARYQPRRDLQLDFGPTIMGYIWTDDCSECTGTFVGVYFVASAGHKFVFIGPWLRALVCQ